MEYRHETWMYIANNLAQIIQVRQVAWMEAEAMAFKPKEKLILYEGQRSIGRVSGGLFPDVRVSLRKFYRIFGGALLGGPFCCISA
jgi:hypothetical protein